MQLHRYYTSIFYCLAGDCLKYHNGRKFSTKDQNNEGLSEAYRCPQLHHGAWWYHSCLHSNLNGRFNSQGTDDQQSIFWCLDDTGKPNILKSVDMAIHPYLPRAATTKDIG